MLKNVIRFDESARNIVLDALDKAVDSEGFVVEKKDTKQRVLTERGDQVKATKLAGIRKGSFRFFETDLPSILSLSDELE